MDVADAGSFLPLDFLESEFIRDGCYRRSRSIELDSTTGQFGVAAGRFHLQVTSAEASAFSDVPGSPLPNYLPHESQQCVRAYAGAGNVLLRIFRVLDRPGTIFGPATLRERRLWRNFPRRVLRRSAWVEKVQILSGSPIFTTRRSESAKKSLECRETRKSRFGQRRSTTIVPKSVQYMAVRRRCNSTTPEKKP